MEYLRHSPLTTGQASVVGFRAIRPPQGGGLFLELFGRPLGIYRFAVQKLRRNFSTYLISDLVKAGLLSNKIF